MERAAGEPLFDVAETVDRVVSGERPQPGCTEPTRCPTTAGAVVACGVELDGLAAPQFRSSFRSEFLECVEKRILSALSYV